MARALAGKYALILVFRVSSGFQFCFFSSFSIRIAA